MKNMQVVLVMKIVAGIKVIPTKKECSCTTTRSFTPVSLSCSQSFPRPSTSTGVDDIANSAIERVS